MNIMRYGRESLHLIPWTLNVEVNGYAFRFLLDYSLFLAPKLNS